MKRPSQTISFTIPSSSQLRVECWKNRDLSDAYLSLTFPTELIQLAVAIRDTSHKLASLCDEFDFAWLHAKQDQVKLMRHENARLVQLERERKAQRETAKIRKQEISGQTKLQKRISRNTGLSYREYLAQEIEKLHTAFKEFDAKFGTEPPPK